jgi:hypothetical protein
VECVGRVEWSWTWTCMRCRSKMKTWLKLARMFSQPTILLRVDRLAWLGRGTCVYSTYQFFQRVGLEKWSWVWTYIYEIFSPHIWHCVGRVTVRLRPENGFLASSSILHFAMKSNMPVIMNLNRIMESYLTSNSTTKHTFARLPLKIQTCKLHILSMTVTTVVFWGVDIFP